MIEDRIRQMPGPILVLGASGFVGASLFKRILQLRKDVYGTTQRPRAWRLDGIDRSHIHSIDLLVESNLDQLFSEVGPQTVFNCTAYGAYSFESQSDIIHRTNFLLVTRLLKLAERHNVKAFVHCGSSSEYGTNCNRPKEEDFLAPNSDYAVAKAGAAHAIHYFGKQRQLPCANLRLYSVYGPEEDSSRLIPNVIRHAVDKKLPPLVHPDVSRDFIYLDDTIDALVAAATNIEPAIYGESFNISSGEKTTIADLANTVKTTFGIDAAPDYGSYEARDWDLSEWVGNPDKARKSLDWQATTSLSNGLRKMCDWYQGLDDKHTYEMSSKRHGIDLKHSVSAIITCYEDGKAIPIMYQRLTDTFNKIGIDYEIIFVNDCSPDDTEQVISDISSRDRRVLGISHARNFGSQAAFRSGMALSSKSACVLLDGDLQDPPELIEQFVKKWREGYDVVFGRRIDRDAPWYMRVLYKAFYRIFNRLSYLQIPADAGDFSLISARAVKWLLQCGERDLFIRGLRAYVGFKQTGIDYKRPERMFGVSTNSFLKNIGWAKKGALSFTTIPLNSLSGVSVIVASLAALLILGQIVFRLLFPELTPKGLTTVLVVVVAFSALNLAGIALLGEYIAKIFEETKRRPHYVRRALIKDGEIAENVDI